MDNSGIYFTNTADELETVAAALGPPLAQWPALGSLGLAAAERDQRRSFIGGSDANIILSGDRDRILQLWREKRGELEPEDLSGTLPVMLGCWTEAFNRQWYERLSGERVSSGGVSVICQRYLGAAARSTGSSKARARSGRPSTPAPLPRPRRCSSATCRSFSTIWRCAAPSGRCCR